METKNPFEKAPSEYEQLLETARQVRERGIDPFESSDFTRHSNPEVVELWDKYHEWVSSCDFFIRGSIQTVEKAENVVKAAMFWIEAGYTDKTIIQEALDTLILEEEDTQKIPDNAAAAQILTDAVEKLEALLSGPKQEKGGVEVEIEKIQTEAEEKFVAGDVMSATRMLASILVNGRYQRIFKKNPELRAQIDKRANEFSAEFKRIRYKK